MRTTFGSSTGAEAVRPITGGGSQRAVGGMSVPSADGGSEH